MRKEKGRKSQRKNMDEREKESEIEERTEVTEEGIERREDEEIEECPVIEEAVEEEERWMKKIHSAILQPRDSQEVCIVEFGQGRSTFPQQGQKIGSLGRNICRTQAPAL